MGKVPRRIGTPEEMHRFFVALTPSTPLRAGSSKLSSRFLRMTAQKR